MFILITRHFEYTQCRKLIKQHPLEHYLFALDAF